MSFVKNGKEQIQNARKDICQTQKGIRQMTKFKITSERITMKPIFNFMIATIIVGAVASTAFISDDVFASKKSPYDSGYDHGCSDARISNYNDRYINQYEKGPAFHTNEFMNGYNIGYDLCSGNNNVSQQPIQSQGQSQASNNENSNENNNALSQSQTTQIYICNDKGCTVQR